MIVNTKYQRHLPPFTKGKKVLVDLHVEVQSILNIMEVDSLIQLQYKLKLKWRDSRLTFRNLRENAYMNSLGHRDVHRIWLPRVVVLSTPKKAISEVRLKLNVV